MAEAISESSLVKDALHAMQGVPAAIERLDAMAAFSQPADKSCHTISTLWSPSLSATSLAKVLKQIAEAGSIRRKLDSFVDFFIARKYTSRRNKKNNHLAVGLINQAFATAVKTILMGHTACLDTLIGSVYSRRLETDIPAYSRNGGPLFGFGHVSLTLLELFLHTEVLRVELQALLKICMVDEPLGLFGERTQYRDFPRGANVLTHLYQLLMEPDPAHLELLRFLFSRTLEPYASFIRSCIYGAALKDPFGEFIVEQVDATDGTKSTLKIRSGVNVPIFLVQACNELLRAGQQLEVLLKLSETREFAQQFAALAEPSPPEDTGSDPENSNEETFRLKQLEPEPEQPDESSDTFEVREDDASTSDSSTKTNVFSEDSPFSFTEDVDSVNPTHAFLEKYHRGNSWLDVGLPRNPFYFCNDDAGSYRYLSTNFSESCLVWDISSDIINEEILRKKLVPELAQVKGFLSLEPSSEPRPISDSLDRLLREADRSISVPVISFSATPPPPEDAVSLELSTAPETTPEPKRFGGGSWETSLRHSETPASSSIVVSDKVKMFDSGSEDVPISVIVERCILREISTQYRFVSGFTVELFREKLFLRNHCLALRRYYFMEAGDWADNFVSTLCSQKNGVSWIKRRRSDVQGVLEASLQKSSTYGDTYAEKLYICEAPGLDVDSTSYHCLTALDFVELGYHVEWPLNLVLTSQAFTMYKLVFKFLLRVRLVVFALGEISTKLLTLDRGLQRSRNASSVEKDHFRVLQLFRHQIGHFVTALQCHVQSQLLHVVWTTFSDSIQQEAKDMQDLELVHSKYLDAAIHQCFLSTELDGIKSRIDSIMQCLLDLRSLLLCESNAIDDVMYSKVLDLRSSFHKDIESLHKLSQHSIPEFFMSLDYNGFFSQNHVNYSSL